MISYINRVIGILCVTMFSALISGCGGGDSGTKESLEKNGKITFSNNKVEHHAFENQTYRADSRIRIDVSQDIYNKAKNGTKVYFFIESTNPSVAYTELALYAEDGHGILYLTSRPNLTPGEYSSEVNVKGCFDSACNNEFGRAKLDYIVKIFEIPKLQEVVNLKALDDSLLISDKLEINLNNLVLENHDWSASATYENSDQGWLSLEKSSSNGLGVLSFGLSRPLECGIYNANIQIDVNSSKGLYTQLTVPLTLNVESQHPKITSVMPKVHYEGQPLRVLLNGCKLSSLDLNNLVVSGINVTNAKAENNYQLYLDAEPVSQIGDVIVDVKNVENSLDNTITIKAPQNYSYQFFDLKGEGLIYGKSLFNPLTNTLYIEQGAQQWVAIKGNGESWVKDPQFAFSNIQDLELSNDNKSLLALKEGKLIKFDAFTYTQTILEDSAFLSGATSLSMYNDNKILFGRDTAGSDTAMLIYSTSSKLFSYIDIETGYDPAPFRSRNGATAFVSTYHYEALYKIVDQGKKAKKVLDNFIDNVRTSMSQDGKRILAVNALVSYYESGPRTLSIRDENFIEHFALPVELNVDNSYLELADATISDNGNEAYILYKNPTYEQFQFYVIKYDLTGVENGRAPEKVAATWVNESVGVYPQIKLSIDGNTLFIFGHGLVVLPTSTLTKEQVF